MPCATQSAVAEAKPVYLVFMFDKSGSMDKSSKWTSCSAGLKSFFGDAKSAGMSASYWGSLLPAAWSFMLALRSRGLGSAWTTLHLVGDGERQVAEILGIPFERYSQGGLFPIAYTKGTDFKPAKRLPAEQLTHWDSW